MAALAERISERMASVRCSDELDALAAIYSEIGERLRLLLAH